MFTFLSAAPVAKMIDKNQESLRRPGDNEGNKHDHIEVNKDNCVKCLCKTGDNHEKVLQQESDEVKRVKKHNLTFQNLSVNANSSYNQRAVQVSKRQEGYGPEPNPEACSGLSKYETEQCGAFSANKQERNLVSEMCEIRRNEKTDFEGDLEKVLQYRAEIYGNQLETTWFSHGSDLSIKLKSQRERNIARSMLVGAPVLVAQKGAQKLRKRMLEGDSQVLENLQ